MLKVGATVLAAFLALLCDGASAALSDIRPITLRPGVNAIPHLAPDGRDGLIVQGAHSGSPSADGASVQFLVLLRRGQDWETVDAQATPSGASDADFGGELIQSIPHVGEDWKRAVAFAWAKVDGSPAFVMLAADRDMKRVETVYDPTPVEVLVYRLQPDSLTEQDHLVLVDRKPAPGCYQNAWLALKVVAGLPLPKDYEGPAAPQACPR